MSKRFRREEENLLMLGQFLSDLHGRYLALRAAKKDPAILDAAKPVMEAYRAYADNRAAGRDAPLPDWTEAFRVEQLLGALMTPEEAAPELTRQLAELRKIDPPTYEALETDRKLWQLIPPRRRGCRSSW